MTYYLIEQKKFVGIPLFAGDEVVDFAPVDLADAERVLSVTNKWRINSQGYAYCRKGSEPNRELVLMHRVILQAGPDDIVDHINRKRLDNRRHNLRFATPFQNAANRTTSGGATGYRGVSIQQSKTQVAYIARIGTGKERRYLGRFSTPEEAAQAYNTAAIGIHGEYALLNEV